MKRAMMDVQDRTGFVNREKLTVLLPTHSEISELIPAFGCIETETFGDVRLAEAINRIVASIVSTPTNHELWRDLANAFGMNPMQRWKYLYIANCLKPDDFQILKELSYTLSIMGDMQGAISLMENAVACATNESERLDGIENTVCLRFPQLAECKEDFLM